MTTPATPTAAAVGELLRELAPQVLGPLARRSARFEDAEDAVQEALLAATVQWPVEGLPDEPRAWLRTVAARRMADQLRSEVASRRREERDVAQTPADAHLAPAPDAESDVAGVDDTLVLLLLCCHPTLTPSSQVALTLRAVGGLTTAEIARAFLVPEATMGQRISRAKQRIRTSGAPFALPVGAEVPTRWAAALHVLYLIFSEGSTATSGADLHRPDLTAEAIRLARLVRRLRPDDGEAAGLLALMLLVDARRAARTRADGSLVPLAEQDRALWDADRIAEGVALLTHALPRATARAVPAAGRHRRRPRRGTVGGGDRLASDRRPLRPARRAWRPVPSSPSTAPSPWPWPTVPRPASPCSHRWPTTTG